MKEKTELDDTGNKSVPKRVEAFNGGNDFLHQSRRSAIYLSFDRANSSAK